MERGSRQGEGQEDLIQTSGHHRWRKNEVNMPCTGTHNLTKRTTNQARNWHTLSDKQVLSSISCIKSVCMYSMCSCVTHPEIIFRAVCVVCVLLIVVSFVSVCILVC